MMMVRLHGNWCGPNWTGGRKLSAAEYEKRGYSWDAPCSDKLDCACRQHDFSCKGPKGCSRKGDSALIKAAKKLQLSELERITQIGIVANPFTPTRSRIKAEKKLDLDTKAGMVESAITLARLTRRH